MSLSATLSQSATIAARLGQSAQNRGGMHRLIPELDGARGIAVLLVMLCHSSMIQAPPESVPFILRNALFLGWSGVDLFFVLSGFLITGILLGVSEPVKLYGRQAFWVKMTSLAIALAITYFAFNPLVRRGENDGVVRSVAVATMAAWLMVAMAGRWIGFS